MFHVKHEAWGVSTARIGVDIGVGQAAALDTYEQLLIDRALPFGMVAAGDKGQLRERHILDSLRAAPLLGETPGVVADLGSGAGLPGVPLAIVRPDVMFRLVETRLRRVSFLELVVDTLGLGNATVVHGQIQRLTPPLDVCLARALADPIGSWRLAEPVLARDGSLLYWAGRGFDPTSGTPEGVRISVSASPGLADAGPVVIMTRQ
jgi:16S rRNA (guanine527-N7)-methyltransferase